MNEEWEYQGKTFTRCKKCTKAYVKTKGHTCNTNDYEIKRTALNQAMEFHKAVHSDGFTEVDVKSTAVLFEKYLKGEKDE